MSNTESVTLKAPRQNLDRCSYFECNEQAVDHWVEALPLANLGQTTHQLYYVLEELNQVRLMPSVRIMVLEKLRKPIHFVSNALSKYFLNQPIILSEQSRKVADLAFTLHQQFSTGYKLVAIHAVALKNKSLGPEGKLVAKALHRASTELALNIQRYYQLYEPILDDTWSSLHSFYALARQQKVATLKVNDSEFGNGSVESSYIKALLIGCAKPNQLRQEDFNGLYLPLNEWAKNCLVTPVNPDSLLVFNPVGDSPPVYRQLVTQTIDDSWRALDTKPLIESLTNLRKQNINSSLIVNGDKTYSISRDLLSHLILSWGTLSQRNFMRIEAAEKLTICVGLSATHHFVSEGISFESLIEKHGVKVETSPHENPFLKVQAHTHRQKDVWDSPYENKLGETEFTLESIDDHIQQLEKTTKTNPTKFKSHDTAMINSSAHGYCVVWPETTVAQLKTGEIIGLKDSSHQNWNIAVIRWLNHQSETTQVGLELISPSASPYGGYVFRNIGHIGEYMRVMLLPEVPVINQPLTLLTPQVPFAEDQKVVLNQRGREVQVRLGKKLNDHGAYSQFELSKIGYANVTPRYKSDNKDEQHKDDEFDSLWVTL